jgi:hypothetical protein
MDDTALIPIFSTRDQDDAITEQLPTATFEGPSPLGLQPLPEPLEGERAYLVEVHAPRREPGLLAVRRSLLEARIVADSVHPGVADVCIRELLLPCDVATSMRALSDLRTWSRDAAGVWSPAFEAFALRESDPGETVNIGAFARGS